MVGFCHGGNVLGNHDDESSLMMNQGLEFRSDNEEEGPVPKPCLGQHAVLGIQVGHQPPPHHHIKNNTVTHSINAFDQEFQSASELENLSFDIRQMKLQVIFKRD